MWSFNSPAQNSIRRIYYDLTLHPEVARAKIDEFNYHIIHCVDYLRQALMCAADATLEPNIPGTRIISGIGIDHQCQDYESLIRWAESKALYL